MRIEDFMNFVVPEYSYIFNFEKSYSYAYTQEWLLDNDVYCFCCGMLYFTAVTIAMTYMLYNPKYDLKRPFALWCGLMALLSIIGFARTAPELYIALDRRNLYYSICKPR